MPASSLFPNDPTVAQRQPKTDRLILARYLDEEATKKTFDESAISAAHAVLVKWADLETGGTLGKLKETQMQGDFLAEVFGDALGYAGPIDGASDWQRLQHQSFGGDTPDAILGRFGPGLDVCPLAVVELKGPKVHLDRDRSGGRTAVDQCWHYLNNTPPECRWGIVSNYVSFRLYERNSTKRKYEHFTLQSLRDPAEFRRFYVLFQREGLIERKLKQEPRAVALLKRSTDRQREVSDELFEAYSKNRTDLIAHLHFELKHPLDMAIEMAQRLFDRIMFIAFCEDRGLLPEGSIKKARQANGFYAVTNPRWQNFKNLFRFIDNGSQTHGINRYNGGLFAVHPVDNLELPDDPWTNFFHTVGGFDFADEVNLDVLGALFERSITELEKLKETGLFGGSPQKAREYAEMPQSAKRKRLGIYYTPEELTLRIVQYTVDELIDERFQQAAVGHGGTLEEAAKRVFPAAAGFWRECLTILRNLKIVDPACGSGAFLFQAYSALEQRYLEVIGHLEEAGEPDARELAQQVPHFILSENLYGVDLSPEAVEIAQLALWIRSAAPGQTLETLSANIVHGNSLVHDVEVHPAGFDWRARFPVVFEREESGFDCVIGNPPWERIKLQEREFFSLPAPEIATATNAATRRKLVAKLESDDPALYSRYQEALESAGALLDYCRKSGAYPLTGKGDINTYAVFAELASQLVAPHGRVGLLVPSGIASDNTTKEFFAAIAETGRLHKLFDFENRLKKFFPEIDNRFKFCILNFGGEGAGCDEADFAFFLHRVEELEDPKRHIPLSAADIALLNPNTRTCPIFRSKRDANITKAIYRRVGVLIDRRRKGPTGNPWGITFKTMFHQTNDAELFLEPNSLKQQRFKPQGNRWVKGKRTCLPLYEAKMLQAYDHRAANVVTDKGNWVRQGQTESTDLVHHQNPEHFATPRFWVEEEHVSNVTDRELSHLLCIKDVTSPTNQRTMIAAFTPFVGVVNSAPILLTTATPRHECCLIGNLNSFAYDFIIRQKISNLHLNFFIVEQIPTISPDVFAKPCRWDPATTLEAWISERVLKLTCTAEDMLPLAEACGFTGGSFQEYGGRLNKWDEAERAQLMAELDAAFFHLYGINRDDAEYILSTFKGIHDCGTLLPGHVSTAEFIIQKHSEMSFAR